MGYFKKRALVIQDVHIPYHDKAVLALILSLITKIKFDYIIINGDMFDFHQLSKYVGDPKRRFYLQDELDELAFILAQIRLNAPNAHIVYVLGNHEKRLQQYLFRRAPEVASLRSLMFNELIHAEQFGVQMVEQEYALNKKLLIRHGGKAGKFPAKNELQSWLKSSTTGHAHKDDYCNINTYEDTFEHFSFGHLSDEKQLKEQYAQEFAHTWNKSFGIFEFNENDFYGYRIKVDRSGKFYCPIDGVFYEPEKISK